MSRLTSDFFVANLIRRVNAKGGFAAVVKRGAFDAGAIHILVRQRGLDLTLYGPAPQQYYDDERPIDRWFFHNKNIVNDEDVARFVESETGFDRDFWLLELEIDLKHIELPFEIMTP